MSQIVDPVYVRRFWFNTLRSENGCLEWQRCVQHGYGIVMCDGRNQKAHRVAWQIIHGPIPKGKCVLHRCDNGKCVDAESHLFIGTNKENTDDMLSKGRDRRLQGSQHQNAKLTEAKVIEARRLARTGQMKLKALAERYNVSLMGMYAALRGSTWKQVTQEPPLDAGFMFDLNRSRGEHHWKWEPDRELALRLSKEARLRAGRNRDRKYKRENQNG